MISKDYRKTKEDIVMCCKWLFYGGLLGLPFLWLIAYVYLKDHMHRRSCPPEVKFYVRLGGVLFLIEMTLFCLWFFGFQLLYPYVGQDGILGDQLLLVTPHS